VDAARLRRDADIAVVWNKGVRSRNALFSMRALPNRRGEMRLAVSASRTLGTAVARNRARRRIREAFRSAVAGLDARAGLDVVIVAQPALLRSSFAALRSRAAESLASLAQRSAGAV
jgi:ribonuclease P protein component